MLVDQNHWSCRTQTKQPSFHLTWYKKRLPPSVNSSLSFSISCFFCSASSSIWMRCCLCRIRQFPTSGLWTVLRCAATLGMSSETLNVNIKLGQLWRKSDLRLKKEWKMTPQNSKINNDNKHSVLVATKHHFNLFFGKRILFALFALHRLDAFLPQSGGRKHLNLNC